MAEEGAVFAVKDKFPVTPGHLLIIPKRHVEDYFSMSERELRDTNILLRNLRDISQREDHTITGFNIGVNCGVDAGQTIMHAHIHLIPRRTNDTQNPQGGVRHLIPGKGYY